MRKIRQIRLQTANKAKRDIIQELSAGPHDEVVFAARRSSGQWVTRYDTTDANLLWACELLSAEARARLLIEHLNRIEGGDGGS